MWGGVESGEASTAGQQTGTLELVRTSGELHVLLTPSFSSELIASA